MSSKEFTFDEVTQHNKEGDLWVVIDSKVYDLSRFADLHPGGANVLYANAGKDATQVFFGLHRLEVLQRPQYSRLQVGAIRGQTESIKPLAPGELSLVPYAEPTWLTPGYFSPYYSDNHRQFHKAVRAFFMEFVYAEAIRCEDSGKRISQEVVDKLSEINFLAMRLGPGKHLKGLTLMGGMVKPEEYDYFHELSNSLCRRWITNGTFSDYFTTLCKTDAGLVVLLIERTDAVSTKAVKTSYSATAGTAFVTFDKARVPVANTLGQVGKGLSVILSNFNHERWMVTATSLGAQRVVVDECLKWTNQRIAFGKPLHAQSVIRAKLAAMISRVEACQAWVENITLQMNNMSYHEQSDKLAGPIALLKQFVSKAGRETAEDATQIFGGRGITASGMGKIIENYHRTSPFDAILAGAEDVLGDLGVRQAIRKMPQNARL
ncbi:hypothetical protein AZE42_03490 [Rhizopogon vesiculosus]|uniref:Cytochrome b5 heme-binding domain-containing protein n=1 Tax=Rhizopogon vesiculosus TaxID=180088 RepID=A0A1J8QWT6_9AGAM|nr:hypothetical protein AZE42_03490 [Rhizopogon vesiculosus]